MPGRAGSYGGAAVLDAVNKVPVNVSTNTNKQPLSWQPNRRRWPTFTGRLGGRVHGDTTPPARMSSSLRFPAGNASCGWSRPGCSL
ncbi:hypothetical protein [Streptomyces sp. R35]|uniref:Uncharacterized protein n=1 Tax=Streptomyces sp. R35 TaxID=3238630 RepID=A0AB39RYU7_9ACTN